MSSLRKESKFLIFRKVLADTGVWMLLNQMKNQRSGTGPDLLWFKFNHCCMIEQMPFNACIHFLYFGECSLPGKKQRG
jgi:hypothetical protein